MKEVLLYKWKGLLKVTPVLGFLTYVVFHQKHTMFPDSEPNIFFFIKINSNSLKYLNLQRQGPDIRTDWKWYCWK